MGNAVFKAALFLFYEGNGTNRGAGAIFNLEGQRCKQDFIGKGSQIVQVFDDQDTFGKERLMSRIRPAEYVESQSIAADDFHFLFCQILGTVFCQTRPVRQEFIIIRFQGVQFVPSEMEKYGVLN